ncbi:hypothetical protein QU487_03960 [Crenobacter sp. SG2305]|uniref:COG4648 family protein n=1 Tax=Crenobacter oryzisoli TaxID=3056844 RepID=UPI0025AACB7F|nr:hypothetical protein [Crenobacter sp. SG2305]MDN0081909.1 hypothetical protein [Crenobacter sp. SG2305]
MTGLWSKLRLVLLVAAGAGYLILDYMASSSSQPPVYAVLIGAIPLTTGVVAVCWNSSFRWPAMLLCLGGLVAIALNFDRLLTHAAWLSFFQYVGIMIGLGIMFGSTLGSHEGALCSRIARTAVAEPLDAHYLHYTWKVTLAWTLYFAASALVSLLLFAFAPLAWWALFASLLTPVSLGLMFGGEYLIRLRALPGQPHFSIAQTIRAYRQYTQSRDAAE